MTAKKFVLNADDFGMSEAYNRAILEGYAGGILRSASLVANGEAFDAAISQVIPACPELGVGLHLNIIEGKALTPELNQLTDVNGQFKNSYVQMLIKSYNPKEKEFLEQVEKEFRAQIEEVRAKDIKITHIDSHVHVHSIPPIFEIVCRLAREYGINHVRTQFEQIYFVPDIFVHLSKEYLLNLVKIGILDTFTLINRKTLKKYGLKSNDYLIGVGYTGMMSSLTVSCGLTALKDKKDITAEALIHPCRYEDGTIDNHFMEFQLTKNQKLKNKIEQLGFEIGNYQKK